MFIESAGEGLRADREHALRCAAYQTLTHRSDKRVARWIGMPARSVAHVNGPSTRVGAAQDLAELDIDLAAITRPPVGSRRGCRCNVPRDQSRAIGRRESAENAGRDSIGDREARSTGTNVAGTGRD
jgi:hypothetical protein